MIWVPETGLAALCLAFLVSLGAVWLGVSAAFFRGDALAAIRRMTMLGAGLVAFSFVALLCAYGVSDFSVINVYENSHTAKPLLYKLTGSWGNHEGSMLLWAMLLAGFGVAYVFAPARDAREKAVALAVLALVLGGFVLFILLTSNPFTRLNPPPMEGQDLNPLLQDIGLALHPPLLYLGYVGFSVVFAQAVAALATGAPIDSRWARMVRPWALLAWSFLTAGIGLGSWWAYRELGWGGWWFWDPVENISLLPWLSATALLHCLLVLAKRPVLQNWTLLLAIFTFAFSLMGTFLVRSGLLTSVHSFASDPARGMYILLFITILTGGSLLLYCLRYPRPSPPDFLPLSREGGIMVNNLLLVTLCVTVLLGIIYPLLMQVFALPAVSVGEPFYNAVVVPVCVPLLLVAGIGPLLAWKRHHWQATRKLLLHAAVAGLGVLVVSALLFSPYLAAWLAMPMAVLVGLCGVWALASALAYLRRQWRILPGAEVLGMALAHAGLGIFAIAASFASAGRIEAEQRILPGQRVQMAGYEVQLAALEEDAGANYIRRRATVHLTSDSQSLTLYPETRFYPARGMETSESSIHSALAGDVYTAIATLGDIGNDAHQTQHVILRVYLVPAIGWVWLGFLMVATGGGLAAYAHFRKKDRDYA